MNKYIFLFLFLFLFSCKSIENKNESTTYTGDWKIIIYDQKQFNIDDYDVRRGLADTIENFVNMGLLPNVQFKVWSDCNYTYLMYFEKYNLNTNYDTND